MFIFTAVRTSNLTLKPHVGVLALYVFHEERNISGDIQFLQLVTASAGSDERKCDLKWQTVVSPYVTLRAMCVNRATHWNAELISPTELTSSYRVDELSHL